MSLFFIATFWREMLGWCCNFFNIIKEHFCVIMMEWVAGNGTLPYHFILTHNEWKMSAFGSFLVLIFTYLNWIPRDTPFLSVFSPNAGKYGPGKLQKRAFLGSFTWSELVSLSKWASITWLLNWYSLGESDVSQDAAFPSTWNYHYNNVKGESMKYNGPNLEIIPFMIWQLQKELI